MSGAKMHQLSITKYYDEYYDDEPISNYWNYSDYKKDTNDPTKSPNRRRFWDINHYVFNNFTNTGKLSKTELHGFTNEEVKLVKADAEQQLV